MNGIDTCYFVNALLLDLIRSFVLILCHFVKALLADLVLEFL